MKNIYFSHTSLAPKIWKFRQNPKRINKKSTLIIVFTVVPILEFSGLPCGGKTLNTNPYFILYTGGHISPYSKFSANCFCYFRHPRKIFHKQMIYHLKALLESSQNLEKEWAWHHLKGFHVLLSEKALLWLKLIYRLKNQRYSKSHCKF